eukprot:sb/3474332/
MEYASENEQLKLYNFFNEIISGLPDAFNAAQGLDQAVEGNEGYFSKLANPNYVTLEPEYRGPELTYPLTLEQVKNLIEALKEKEVLHAKHLLQLLAETRKHFLKIRNVQYTNTAIAGKITVIGDLHGSLADLLMIFHKV